MPRVGSSTISTSAPRRATCQARPSADCRRSACMTPLHRSRRLDPQLARSSAIASCRSRGAARRPRRGEARQLRQARFSATLGVEHQPLPLAILRHRPMPARSRPPASRGGRRARRRRRARCRAGPRRRSPAPARCGPRRPARRCRGSRRGAASKLTSWKPPAARQALDAQQLLARASRAPADSARRCRGRPSGAPARRSAPAAGACATELAVAQHGHAVGRCARSPPAGARCRRSPTPSSRSRAIVAKSSLDLRRR